MLGAGTLGLAMPGPLLLSAQTSGSKPLRGIFPIAQTPFTQSNQLDLDSLVEEVRFIDRGGVHGFVWPQMASEWPTLTEPERLEGMEAIASTGKALRPAIVLGVQSGDVQTSVEYAKHAEKVGADAIISLPLAGKSDPLVTLEYYKEVGKAANLPMFVQSSGDMTVDAVIEIHEAVPTMRFVKDEAGRPLERIQPLREKSADQVKVFSGGHGRTLLEEMRRGSSGSMPAASFADLYAQTWDLWQQGKRQQAMDMHAKTLLLLTEMAAHGTMESMKYILCERGVFKTHLVRTGTSQSRPNAAAGGSLAPSRLDESSKTSLRETLEFVQPHFKA